MTASHTFDVFSSLDGFGSYGPGGDWGGYWGKQGPELEGRRDWPDATVATGDAVEVVRRLKEESDVPLRSHGSLTLNLTLLAAGLVDVLQVTVFPVVTGVTGPTRCSGALPTSTSSCSSSARSTAARRSSSSA